MNQEIPKAWLPAIKITDEREKKYENLLSDLCSVGHSFEFKCWAWNGFSYQHAVDTQITPSKKALGEASIELRVTKRFQSRVNVGELGRLNFRRAQPTSNIWTKHMRGQPSPSSLANHALAGIALSAGFEANMGFEIKATSNEAQSALDEIAGHHRAWGVRVYPDMWFLNT